MKLRKNNDELKKKIKIKIKMQKKIQGDSIQLKSEIYK